MLVSVSADSFVKINGWFAGSLHAKEAIIADNAMTTCARYSGNPGSGVNIFEENLIDIGLNSYDVNIL